MWLVRLKSGSEIEVWADFHDSEPVDGEWKFGVLVEASADEQQAVRVENRTVPPSDRCVITVARIPAGEVDSIVGGWPLSEDPRSGPAAEANEITHGAE